jgi:putative peptidoglycan lipid II flippase
MVKSVRLATLSFFNLLVTFAFQCLILIEIGVGEQTDAFFASITVPTVVVTIATSVLMNALVPMFAGEEEHATQRQAWSLAVIIYILLTTVAAALAITTNQWVPLLSPGFDSQNKKLTAELACIVVFVIGFGSFNCVLSALYHAQGRFVSSEGNGLISGLFAIFALAILLPMYGIQAAAWCTLARAIAHSALLAMDVGPTARFTYKELPIEQLYNRIKPLLLGSVVFKSDVVLERLLLSLAPGGSVTLYYFAQQIYGLCTQLTYKVFIAPLIASMSVMYKARDMLRLRLRYRRGILMGGVFSIVAYLALVIVGFPIAQVITSALQLEEFDLLQLWIICIFLGGIFVFGCLGQITAGACFATGDPRVPMVIGIVTYFVCAPLKAVTFLYYGVTGIAAVSSVFYLVNFVAQYAYIEKLLVKMRKR